MDNGSTIPYSEQGDRGQEGSRGSKRAGIAKEIQNANLCYS